MLTPIHFHAGRMTLHYLEIRARQVSSFARHDFDYRVVCTRIQGLHTRTLTLENDRCITI